MQKLTLSSILASAVVCACAVPTTEHENVARASSKLAESAIFFTRFVGDGDVGQCNGGAYGTVAAPIGEWTPAVRIDTDDRPGGCLQQFAITDPTNSLAGLTFRVSIGGLNGQCDNGPNVYDIPVTADGSAWTPAMRIDADSRPAGCEQHFALWGRNDIVFDVAFFADDDPSQCPIEGIRTLSPGGLLTLEIDTDNRPGGCRESFRLRRVADNADSSAWSPPPPPLRPAGGRWRKIMPLGDSITYGGDSGGYRAALDRRWVLNHIPFTLAGTMLAGPNQVEVDNRKYAFPRGHNGYSGYLIQGMYSTKENQYLLGLQERAWADIHEVQPDVVALMIGTNDMLRLGPEQIPDAPARLEKLVDTILNADPKLRLVVAQIPLTAYADVNANIATYNAAIASIVRQRAQAGRNIDIVDMAGAFSTNAAYVGDYLADGVHPSLAGYSVMGAMWFSGI